MVKINIKDDYLNNPIMEFTEGRQFLKLSWLKDSLDAWMWNAEVQFSCAFEVYNSFRVNCDNLPHSSKLRLLFSGSKELTKAEKNAGMMIVSAEDREYFKC